MDKEKVMHIKELKEKMEFYCFLFQREKGINHDKYIFYLAKADSYKTLYEEELNNAKMSEEEFLLELEKYK